METWAFGSFNMRQILSGYGRMLFLNDARSPFTTNINSNTKMEALEEIPHHSGGIYNYFQGATIHNLVINGNMNKHGSEHYHEKDSNNNQNQYSDEQVCTALSNIVGKGKAIDSKQKWAGALWYLRWECNYPAKAQEFCDKISRLALPKDLEFQCDYNNIRALSTLSFMNEDARKLEQVKYSKNDEQIFFQMRNVVVALREELQKITA